MLAALEQISANKCFDGWQKRFAHRSSTLRCNMHVSVFEPPAVADGKSVPVLYWLSGLTCTDENVVIKAGAQRLAAELNMLLVMPDTSPRGEDVPDAEDGAYDLGLGAGFYLNATQAPWDRHYHMYDYVVSELPALIDAQYQTTGKSSIFGHSMGGHGALTIALKNPTQYQSVSAFAPIVNPTQCDWGEKAFSHYLGDDKSTWLEYDACELISQMAPEDYLPTLIDQGLDDNFYASQKLTKPFDDKAAELNYPAQINYHPGYDHSYFFIASFIDAHLRFHAKYLG